jgi:hypothetical protein
MCLGTTAEELFDCPVYTPRRISRDRHQNDDDDHWTSVGMEHASIYVFSFHCLICDASPSFLLLNCICFILMPRGEIVTKVE